jgi:hypothetical protein
LPFTPDARVCSRATAKFLVAMCIILCQLTWRSLTDRAVAAPVVLWCV